MIKPTDDEGVVKKEVKKVLNQFEPHCWYFMVVPGGFGIGGLPDFIGLYHGKFFAIETKRPGRRGEANGGMSGLQVRAMKLILMAGGVFFKVDDDDTVQGVLEWLNGNGTASTT